jgi:hypothetical protein
VPASMSFQITPFGDEFANELAAFHATSRKIPFVCACG